MRLDPLRVVAGHWAPQHAGVDATGRDVVRHLLGRHDHARIDRQRIGLRQRHQAVMRHDGGGRRAGDDADVLALEPRILQRLDAVQAVARLEHQRVGRAVVRVRGLHQVVADRHTHHHVAAQRIQGVAHEADHLREVDVADGFAELGGEQCRELVLESRRRSRRRTAGCAGPRRRGTPWGRPVPPTRRDRAPGRSRATRRTGSGRRSPRDTTARSAQCVMRSGACLSPCTHPRPCCRPPASARASRDVRGRRHHRSRARR